jgi:NitT/TauT family transport system permease protein
LDPENKALYALGLQYRPGLSWKAGVAAELIGIPSNSLGEMLYYSKIYFNTLDLFAWTVIIVLLSIGFEKLFISLLKFTFRRIEKI